MGVSRGLLRAAFCAALIGGASAASFAQCNSSAQLISQRTVAPNLNASAIAWSGSRLGVSKVDGLNEAKPIYFATYDADLQQLTADVKLSDGSFNGPIALVWSGTEFGLFYLLPGLQLVLQRVSATGQPIGGPIEIAAHHLKFPEDEYDVTWDSFRQSYDVVRTISEGFQSGLWLMFVEPTGALRSELMLSFFQARAAIPRVAATTDGTIGVIFRHLTLKTLALTRLTTDNTIQVLQHISTNENGRIAARDSGFVILTSSHDGSGRGRIEWTRVDASGNLTAETPLFTSTSLDVSPISLLWNPARDEWALSYLDSQFGFDDFPASYRLRRFRPNGALVLDTLFTVDSLRSTATTTHPFVYTSQGYVSAVQLFVSRAEGSDSYLLRHCPLTASINANAPFPRPTDPITFTANVAGGTPGYTYTWDPGDLTDPLLGPVVTYPYPKEGTYTVTLTVTDSVGSKFVVTKTVKVKIGKLRGVRK